jgi:hypothetical protein
LLLFFKKPTPSFSASARARDDLDAAVIPPNCVSDFVSNTPGPLPGGGEINCMKEGNGFSGTTNYSRGSEFFDTKAGKVNRHFGSSSE